MIIEGHECVLVDTSNIQKNDIVVWTDRRGQHTNRVIEVYETGVKIQTHVVNDVMSIPLDSIKKCWRQV